MLALASIHLRFSIAQHSFKGSMKRLILNSERYPGLGLVVPQIPGAPAGVGGGFTFTAGISYDVTPETAALVEQTIGQFEPRVKRHYSLAISDIETAAAAVTAVVVPEVTPAAEPVDLSTDDDDLVSVEVAKLKGLTIAQATPIVENTAMNDELPIELRRAYLQAVIETRTAKAIDKLATELLETLAD